MGLGGSSNNRRSNIVKFRGTFSETMRYHVPQDAPRVKTVKFNAEGPIPSGKQLLIAQTYGSTQQEQLMGLAPDEGSTPEKMVYGWLVRNKVSFEYQASVMGGRLPGGAVVDFVIYIGMRPTALRIMGYWHAQDTSPFRDATQKEALEEEGYTVVDVWEQEVNTMDKVNWVMIGLLYGFQQRSEGGVAGFGSSKNNCPYCDYSDCVKCNI